VTGSVAPHPDLGRLASLLGEWEGEGSGRWGGGDTFFYREWLSFNHNGKPFLIYSQRTASRDDGRPMHGESGYWRAAPDDGVELVLAHGIGVAEIEVGRWDGNTLRLRTESMRVSPSAKLVTALERDFELDGDTLRYTLRMSRDDASPQWHLAAELHRVPS
jgi:THAP4-like, heme-binding beta-barrel domain